MKTISVFVLLLLTGIHLMNPPTARAAQVAKRVADALNQWSDQRTVAQWTQAIQKGKRAFAENRFDEAATFFQQAVEVCDRNASGGIHQGVARLLLAETFLEKEKPTEALAEVDRLVKSLEKATRHTRPRDPSELELKKFFSHLAANAHRYQVGAALYLRAARAYCRMGLPQLAEPLFPLAFQIFEQNSPDRPFYSFGLSNSGFGIPVYPQGNLRMAEIREAQCRFHLTRGSDEAALTSLQEAETAKKMPPPVDAQGKPSRPPEIFLDPIIAEPLDKSFLKRFLEDCAFYRFDDARIADLLVRQAALLRKVSRNDEATAFERFAESLRRPRMKQ